jgi:glucose-1-phosphatase
MQQYKNLIFDLGGVIIDLAVERTIQGISSLSGFTEAQIRKAYLNHTEFLAYEKGELTDEEFRHALQQIFSFTADTAAIDEAWNAMLVALPQPKLSLLEKLMDQYTLAVLSNTNNIHLQYVNSVMLPAVSSRKSLNDFFHRHYYSHLVRKRKPEREIYSQVIEECKFKPEETLFLDDNAQNIAAAAALGIQTQIIAHPDDVYELFSA